MRALTKIVGASLAFATTPSVAVTTDPFAFRLELTPEEGPLDPAVEARKSLEWGTCVQGARTTRQSGTCQAEEFLRRNAELNHVWHVTLRGPSAANRRAFIAAQRKWVAARDPFCRKEADRYKGGTISPVIYGSCRVELTIRRTLWLESLKWPA